MDEGRAFIYLMPAGDWTPEEITKMKSATNIPWSDADAGEPDDLTVSGVTKVEHGLANHYAPGQYEFFFLVTPMHLRCRAPLTIKPFG